MTSENAQHTNKVKSPPAAITEGQHMRRLNKNEICTALRQVISDDDELIVVHANVFSFGLSEDILDDFMSAFEEVLQPHQTLLMTTMSLSFCGSGWFHHQETPSEGGALSQHFLKQEGSIRSHCPLNSYAMRGPDADQLQDLGDLDSCWSEHSIFGEMYRRKTRLIGLGEPLSEIGSLFHFAEEIATVPYRYYKTFSGTADFGNGAVPVSRKMYVRRRDLNIDYHYVAAIEGMKEQGLYRSAALSGSYIESVPAREAIDGLIKILKEDPLAVLRPKGAYEKELQKPSFCFLGSSNLDIFTDCFASTHQAETTTETRIITCAFGQYQQDILNPESDLRASDPNYVVFFERAEDLFEDILSDPSSRRDHYKDEITNRLSAYIDTLVQARTVLNGTFIVANFESVRPSPLGNSDALSGFGTSAIIRYANTMLSDAVGQLADTILLDYQALVQKIGIDNAYSGKYWFIGRIPFTPHFDKLMSRTLTGIRLNNEGASSRLIILDLDDTLWGGLAGEGGLQNVQLGGDYPGNIFKSFQIFLKALANRGIALAVCSKNNEADALKVINEHPDMVLKEDDFACIRINWADKAANIAEITNELSLNPANIMFLDNSPYEREMVRSQFTQCVVPELPNDVSRWIDFLSESPYLQLSSPLTDEDFHRKEHYTSRKIQVQNRASFTSPEAFFENLQMELTIAPMEDRTRARTLQLISKTNQFNTTTHRYTERDIEQLLGNNARIYTVSLRDRFTSPEVIAVYILKESNDAKNAFVIDSFIMSCRSMGRTIETAILGQIAKQAKEMDLDAVVGLYHPTDRNKPVENLFPHHGFLPIGDDAYHLDLTAGNSIEIPHYISVIGKG